MTGDRMLTKVYVKVTAVLMVLITGTLAAKCLFYHMDMTPLDMVSELSVKTAHIWPVYLLLLIGVFFVISYFKDRLLRVKEEKLLRILVYYHLFMGIFWMVLANTKEGADQAQVLYAAQAFCKGDFAKLAADGYMGMFPYQLPLALVYEPFYLLFGNVTPYLWQFINVFLICGIQVLLYKIGRTTITAEGAENAVLYALFLNFPILLYVSFVYGTVIGLFLALSAVWLFLQAGTERKAVNIVFSAVCMAAACLLRTNNLIFLIALCIFGVLRTVGEKSPRFLLVFLSLVLFLAGRQAVYSIYEARSGTDLPKGEPMTLNIAMGLADNGERGPGWYNGYTWDKYIELEYDRERADAFAREEISSSLGRFSANPSYAFAFFNAKTDSMWLNPDFQGLWNNEHHGQNIACAPVINQLYHGRLHGVAVSVLSIFMLLVYFGNVLFFILNLKTLTWQQCCLAVCFIGGFLFHLFWEAKAQYAIVYYSLLMPYAGAGLLAGAAAFTAGVQRLQKKIKKS